MRWIFNPLGIEFREISLLDSSQFIKECRSVDWNAVEFVFSFCSMGMDIQSLDSSGSPHNIWDLLGVPFISIHGDSPAYFFDRHIVPSSLFVTLYSYEEHYRSRTLLPERKGIIKPISPIILERIPSNKAKSHKGEYPSELVFLKNGGDPAKLVDFWKSRIYPSSRYIYNALMEISSEIESNLDIATNDRIEDAIEGYFWSREIDLDEYNLLNTKLFLTAQIDDYIRRVKCTKVANWLLDFPVHIVGNNWEHIDFSWGKVLYENECNFRKSNQIIANALAVIDLSPNTSSSPHDRVMRSFGAKTACISNLQKFHDILPGSELTTYSFNKDSLQNAISYAIGHPGEIIDCGIEDAESYDEKFPSSGLAKSMLEYASLARFNQTKQRIEGLQEFFVWPPAKYKE